MKSSPCDPHTLSTLFGGALDGSLCEEDQAAFESCIANDEGARKLWFEFCDVECGLKEIHSRRQSTPSVASQIKPMSISQQQPVLSTPGAGKRWPGLAWAAAAVFVFALGQQHPLNRGVKFLQTAHFEALNDALWASPEIVFHPGDTVHSGQTLELLSGSAELKFHSGAQITLHGPAIFRATSENGAFLKFGRLSAKATAPSAKGFTVQTPTARFEDAGTEFVASAAADGQSQVEVTTGEVFVHIPGREEATRLQGGQALSTDSSRQRVTVRLESGDGSETFRLPSIEAPSASQKMQGARGGSIARLLGAQASAAPILVKQGGDGTLLFDLGRPVAVTKINAYTWVRPGFFDSERPVASQNFELYGSDTEMLPDATEPFDKSSWEFIGRANADNYLRQTGSFVKSEQQACSFSSSTGCLGTYRYLMCVPLRRPTNLAHTTLKAPLGLLDVYSDPWTF